ncbi:MAG: hypothetical protein HYY18_18295 [Planctomycetes bacterium]|nr:hypothetical protein [Planctomycetota bacterium]
MRKLALVLPLAAAVLAAGCGNDPEEAKKKEVEDSKEEITELIEATIHAMQQMKPEVYHASLCEADRNRYPLETCRQDWEENAQLIREQSGSLRLHTIAIDKDDPNIASVVLDAPNHPNGKLLFTTIREFDKWKIQHPPFRTPKETATPK